MHDEIKRPLTDEEMESVRNTDNWVAAFVRIFECLLGTPLPEKVNPTKVRIPLKQHEELFRIVYNKAAADTPSLDRANIAIEFVDKGPSAY